MISTLCKYYLNSFKGIPQRCWQGISLNLIASVFSGICFFLSIYFVQDLHLTIAQAGIILSCYGVGRVVGGYGGGKLSDNIPPRLISIVGLLLQAICFFFLLKLTSFASLCVNLFILGIANYGFITSNNLWVFKQCQNSEVEKLKSINLIYTTSNIGLGLSALFVGQVAGYGFHNLFLISGICLSVLAFITFLDKSQLNFSVIKTQIENFNHDQIISKNHNQIIALILVCLFLISLVVSQRNTTYLIYIHDSFKHLNFTGVSLVFALNPILIIFFQSPLVTSISGFNKILWVGIGALLMGIGMCLLAFANIFFWAIISCVIYTVGEMIFFSLAQIVIYQQGRVDKKGSSFGLFKSVYALSCVLGPSLGGYIYHSFGGNMVWYLSGLVGIICMGICVYLTLHNEHNAKNCLSS